MRTLSCTQNRQIGYMRNLSCTQNRQNGYMRPPLPLVPSPLSPFTQPNMLKKRTLFEIRHLRESEDRVEFKKANQGLFSYNGSGKSKATDRRKCILGYVVAFCNEGGGELIFGVDDAYPHRSKTKTSAENPQPIKTQTTHCKPKHWKYVQNASKITTITTTTTQKQCKTSKQPARYQHFANTSKTRPKRFHHTSAPFARPTSGSPSPIAPPSPTCRV